MTQGNSQLARAPDWMRVGLALARKVAPHGIGLGLLAAALGRKQHRARNVAAAFGVVAGVAALDLWAANKRRASNGHGKLHEVTRAVTIDRKADEIYRYWRNLENLPRFMGTIASVEVLDERRSHWRAVMPAGPRERGIELAWHAEITADDPGRRLAWRSLEPASELEDAPRTLRNSGALELVRAPGGRGTEVRVTMRYEPPAGPIGAAFAKLFDKGLEFQLDKDLRQLKQLLEVGEILLANAPARPPSVQASTEEIHQGAPAQQGAE